MQNYSLYQLPELLIQAQRLINAGQAEKALSLIQNVSLAKECSVLTFSIQDIQGLFDDHNLSGQQACIVSEHLKTLNEAQVDYYAHRIANNIMGLDIYWLACRMFVDEIWTELFPDESLPPKLEKAAADNNF